MNWASANSNTTTSGRAYVISKVFAQKSDLL